METVLNERKSVFDWIIRGSFLLLLVGVPLYFSYDLTTYTLPKIVLSQVLVCILLASWLFKMTLQGELTFKPATLFYPLLVFFLIAALSLFYAASLPGGISLFWQILAYVMLYFIVINNFREEEMETWALVMSLVGFLHSGYGILQSFGVDPLLKGYQYVPHVPFSTLGHRNQAAQYLILLFPLSGAFFFLTSSWWRRVVFGVTTVMMVYHLYLTKSRGGILGFLFVVLFSLGVGLYHRLLRFSLFERRKWLFPLCLFLLLSLPALFLILPGSTTLRAGHLNPFGYYICSIDASKIPAHEPIRIGFDYRILRGNPEKPGYINLYGERTSSPPIYLNQPGEGWHPVQREDIQFSATPYDEDIKLRWVPGSSDSVLQVRKVIVETKGGVKLIRDSFMNRFFSKMGVTEVDKAISSQARFYMYRSTINMIRDNFFLGVGFGNFRYVYPRYRDRGEWSLSGLNTRVDQAHSEFLQVFSEVGLIGLLAFLWILTGIGTMFWQVAKVREYSPQFLKGLALTMGIGATLVQSFFDFNLQNPASGVTFWIAVGFLEIVCRSIRSARGDSGPAPVRLSVPSLMRRGVIAAGISVCLVAGVYYSARPVLGDFYLRQGRLFAEAKDWESAYYYFEKARLYSPYEFDVHFNLGQVCDMVKNYERSVDYYREAIRLHPYFVEARNNLGAAYIRLGLIEEAIEEFKGSIEINPYHPGLHNNLGYLYGKRNLLKQAINEYQQTLALDPQSPEAHKNLGLLYYYKLGDFPKAKLYWERYLALNPEDPQNPVIRQKIEEIQKRQRSSQGHRPSS
jgi:Flp pilus assembly protein TadD/O-antigen ligase